MQTKIKFVLLSCCLPLFVYAGHLSQLCQKGLKNNPKIKSYRHKTSASHSYYKQSIDQYKPHLSISGQYGYQRYNLGTDRDKQLYDGATYDYTFALTQPIYRPKLIHSIKDADARKQLAHIEQKDQEARLVTQILQASIEVLRDKKIINILEKKTALLQKAYDNIHKKYKAKLATNSDLFQAKAMLHQSRSELIQSKQKYDYDKYNLKLITKVKNVDRYINHIDFNIKALNQIKKKADITKFKKLIDRNTQVKYYKKLIDIAKIQIDIRGSERMPNIDAVVSYGDAGGSLDAVTRHDSSRAMLTLSFPIYQGGYVTDRVEEAKFLLLSSIEEFNNLKQNISISIEKAISNIKSGIETIQAQKVALNASKQYFESSIQSYKNGMASLTDAYLAESDYRDNQIKLTNMQADLYLSISEVYYYAGMSQVDNIKRLEKRYFKSK